MLAGVAIDGPVPGVPFIEPVCVVAPDEAAKRAWMSHVGPDGVNHDFYEKPEYYQDKNLVRVSDLAYDQNGFGEDLIA